MGKFVIKEGAAGWRFNLTATNGQVIGVSESYKSEAACENGVESVRTSCLGAVEDQTEAGFEAQKHPKFEVYRDKAGEYRFRLKARNGEIVLVGEGYKEKRGCLGGVDSVKRNAPDAPVVKE